MIRRSYACVLASLLCAMSQLISDDNNSSSMINDGDRILFVGDSITGLGVNFGPGGFINLIKEGLDAARPGSNVTVVPLGGSGQGVGSWMGVEKQSREKDTFLDVKNVNVKEGDSSKDAAINIPAPWLIGYGIVNQQVWEPGTQKFFPSKGILPGEEQFMKGLGFCVTPDGWQGAPIKWTRYVPSIDYTGGNSPGSVCMYAVSFSGNFEAAFGVRWITSDKELPIKITVGTQAFAGAQGISVAVNGEQIYSGAINSEPDRRAVRNVVLRKGLNCLVFKANHCTWQWQFSIDIAVENPQELAGLIFSTVPPSGE